MSLAESLETYDATALAQALQQRQFSAEELVTAHLQRIAELNRNYNVFVALDATTAMERARQADRALLQGTLWGPLHGVPISVKDSFETAGLRTTVGHRRHAKLVPEHDAEAIRKLKRAGAIVLGKTNCAALCGDLQTRNALFGVTCNPYDTQRTSGGSSGGEAAAVALGLSALGLGSDTAGSIRVPSSYCGVYGFKPTLGRVQRHGLRPLHRDMHPRPDSLTVVGPIARSVRDLALAYEILSGESGVRTRVESPRLAWTQQFASLPLADEVTQVLTAARLRLVDAGVAVNDVAAPFDFAFASAAHFLLSNYEFSTVENGYSFYWPRLIERLRALRNGGAEARYQRLKQVQQRLSTAFEGFLGACDAWVLPTTATVAFHHQRTGRAIPITVQDQVQRCDYWLTSAGLTAPISFLGNPSVTIPVGKGCSGMPVAIQVVGKRGADAALLEVAAFIAARLDTVSHCPDTHIPSSDRHSGDGAALPIGDAHSIVEAE